MEKQKMIGFESWKSIIGRHLSFLYESFLISIQSAKEYKVNMYSMIGFDVILILSRLLAFSVILSIVAEIIQWNILDYFMWYVLVLIYWKFYWMHNLRDFNRILLKGDLNTAFTKPINPYVFICSGRMSFNNFVSGIILAFTIFGVGMYQGYSNYVFAFLIMLFGIVSFLITRNLFESIAFFSKNQNVLQTVYDEFDSITLRFTPKLFQETFFKNIVYLFTGVTGYFFVEILKGHFEELLFFLPYILGVFIFSCFGLYLLWHYGLKKYEAFG
jgi:hypothetical protein